MRVIFLQGGDGAKDGQKLVGGQQRKEWSQKKAGEEVGAEEEKSCSERETPRAKGAGGAGIAWTPQPPSASSGARDGALAALAGAAGMSAARLAPTDRHRRRCAKPASD